jgi:hypothetical protein
MARGWRPHRRGLTVSATAHLRKFKASYRYCVDQRCRDFRARRDIVRRLGMPTRAKGIQAGGSLAGKVSIRLRATSSVISVVSIFRKGRAFARPFRLRWCNVLGVFDISLSGCSDRSGADAFMLPRPKLEREYDQRDAKNECVGSQPPGEHNSSDQRRDNKQHAVGKRR